ncbi:MAG: DUF3343 domain-containing protein [Clostridia bacterium]|nr:DUF3343 domain-containing protein [Clostridia bacterium]
MNYCIAVFLSRYDVTASFGKLYRKGINCRMIGTPGGAGAGCGICIQFNCADKELVRTVISKESSTFAGFFNVSLVNGKVLVTRA